MEKIPFVEAGTHLFRFLDPRTKYFWPVITNMLSRHLLFLNSRTQFNDPYDSHPIIKNDLSSASIRSYLKEAIQNPFNPQRSPAGVAQLLILKDSGRTGLTKTMVGNIKTEMHQATEAFLDNAGQLSFSLTGENPLLWGTLRRVLHRYLRNI